MKVIPLGVNAAFSRGKYVQAVDIEVLDEVVRRWQSGQISLAAMQDETRKKSKKLYDPKWQSNFLLEFDQPGKVNKKVTRFVIDFGGDIRHSLGAVDLNMFDIDAWYCSHPHADHLGGTEGIALCTFFHPAWCEAKKKWLGGMFSSANLWEKFEKDGGVPAAAKPDLYGHTSVIDALWHAAQPGAETLQGILDVNVETYFNVIRMIDNNRYQIKDGNRTWSFYTVISTHVIAGARLMPSYGLMFECSDGKKVYFPTDTQLMQPQQIETFYKRADVVYQDTETGPRSTVHAHFDDLRKLTPEIKKKLKLYHYNEEPKPDEGEFGGVLRVGDVDEY